MLKQVQLDYRSNLCFKYEYSYDEMLKQVQHDHSSIYILKIT